MSCPLVSKHFVFTRVYKLTNILYIHTHIAIILTDKTGVDP